MDKAKAVLKQLIHADASEYMNTCGLKETEVATQLMLEAMDIYAKNIGWLRTCKVVSAALDAMVENAIAEAGKKSS